MAFISEIEAVATAGIVQRFRTIDEKHSVVNVVFLSQFTEERVRNNVRPRCFKLYMEYFVCLQIDRGVQPILFIVESGHRFINRSVIWASTFFGL
jgi:hypothetical protein